MSDQFTYFFLGKDGKFYYLDANGKVRTTIEPTKLKYAPEGWEGKKLSWGKSNSLLGLTREFSVPLHFTFDGAVILRYLRYNFGIEAYCRVVIHKLNKQFGAGLLHEDFYGGEVDFSKWQDKDDTVTTEIKDGGLSRLVKANENTAYNIEMDDPEGITVKLDGIYLHEKHNWLIPASVSAADHIIGTQFINKEGTAYGLASFSTFTENNGGGGFDFTTDIRYFFVAVQSITGIRFQGQVKFTYANFGGGPPNQVKLVSNLGQSVVLGTYSNPSGVKEISFDVTFDAAANEKFFLTNDTGAANIYQYDETSVNLSFRSRFKTTYTKALHLKTAAKRLMDKLGGYDVPVQSNVFDIAGKRVAIVLAGGDALRGFATAKLRTSFNDFFKSINVPIPIGFGIEKVNDVDTAVFEAYDYFFRDTIITDLGEVVDFIVNNADEWMGNKIKIGYPNQQYDEVNGRDEYNVTQNYTTPISRLVKELDFVSTYRADAFGVEYTRINFEGKTTTDSDSDNAVFMLLIDLTSQNVDGSYNLYRGPFDELTGVLSPDTVFNVPLSPKTCLYKHGSRWRSIFYRYENEKAVFQTSDKNAEMHYKIGAENYTEKSDVVIGNFSQEPKWLPYVFSFTTVAPVNLPELMTTPAKYGQFQVEWKGKQYYGYIEKEISQQPADNEKQTWKLLCSTKTNVNDLIYA